VEDVSLAVGYVYVCVCVCVVSGLARHTIICYI